MRERGVRRAALAPYRCHALLLRCLHLTLRRSHLNPLLGKRNGASGGGARTTTFSRYCRQYVPQFHPRTLAPTDTLLCPSRARHSYQNRVCACSCVRVRVFLNLCVRACVCAVCVHVCICARLLVRRKPNGGGRGNAAGADATDC